MAAMKLDITDFMERTRGLPILDVRSPGEYHHAHIPGATSFPLFTDEERKVVGTLYKQRSREAAIKTGLEYFGPKMRPMVERAEEITQHQVKAGQPRTVLVHCWRGGMRSGAVAWLLDLYGFKVYTLAGGYKAFRNWVLLQMEQDWPLTVLGGHTGSGKTQTLHHLESIGEQIIDLEAHANHKGSAFGAMDMPPQPSQEQFENLLATDLFTKVTQLKQGQRIWIEDESQRIGRINLPNAFWAVIRRQKVLFLDIPFEARLQFLVDTYGRWNKGEIAAAITRIQKKLGGLETKSALGHLVENDLHACFRILLQYYDKLYRKALLARENAEHLVSFLDAPSSAHLNNAHSLINHLKHVEHSDTTH